MFTPQPEHSNKLDDYFTEYKCPLQDCKAKFGSKYALSKHLKSHASEGKQSMESGVKRFACHFPNCEAKYFYKSGLDAHLKRHNIPSGIPCMNCGLKFKCEYALHSHLRHASCKNDKRYTCTVCHKQFDMIQTLQSHMISKHRGQVDTSEVKVIATE